MLMPVKTRGSAILVARDNTKANRLGTAQQARVNLRPSATLIAFALISSKTCYLPIDDAGDRCAMGYACLAHLYELW